MIRIARTAGTVSTIARTVAADRTPALVTIRPRGEPRGAVLIAHGGQSRGHARDSHLRSPALRMLPFLLDISRAGRRHGIAVAQLRYRVTGYNEGDPVADVGWALARLAERFGVPVCLVGHSMGARAALRAAGEPAVTAVAALAPWCPPAEPVDQLAGRTILIAHGVRDRITDPARSLAYAERAHAAAARVARFELAGTGHAMLERLWTWHSVTRRFALAALGLAPFEPRLADAFGLPPDCAVRVPL
ncbi:MAG TPA: hypothetical protein VE777_04710 [Gaiellales bacterium]|jgi:pimeloyl-ACP methyl ester carboxylesterase|nr:hypothetical protein [Gaiellales bacterium]